MTEWLKEVSDAIEGDNYSNRTDGLITVSPELAAKRVLEKFVVIPKDALPAVERSKHDKEAYNVEGQSIVFTSAANARQWVYRDVAVWQFMEREESATNIRRNELAGKFMVGSGLYNTASESTKAAIDYIIKLEGEK